MRSLSRLLKATSVLWPLYVGVSLCAVLVSATGLVTPFLIKFATDEVVSVANGASIDGVVRTVAVLGLGLLIAETTNTLLQALAGYWGDMMATRMRHLLSSRYYAKLLSLPQRYFDDEVTGTIISRLSRSLMETTQFLNSFSNNFFSMLLTVVAVLVISAFYYWPLALMLFIIFPIYTVLTMMTSKKWQRWEKQKNDTIDAANGRFAEVVSQIRVVKSFVQERRELSLFTRRYGRVVGITQGQSRYWHGMDVLRQVLLNIVFFGVYLMVFVRTAQGHFSVGDMVLLLQLVTMARWPVTMMSYLVDSSQRAIAGSKAYFAVMNLPTGSGEPALDAPTAQPEAPSDSAAVVRSQPATSCGSTEIMVEFEGVNFSYPRTQEDNPAEASPAEASPAEVSPVHISSVEATPVLRDISFRLHSGQRVALVSESGGGKSTLVSLLLGFYEPTSGVIRVAGHDLAEILLEQLRQQIGVVFQEAQLFSGTIAENIAYSAPNATVDQIERVARRANAHEFIVAFPRGYNSTIGERGLKLSGGQKQRIAVARAMLKDAPILVLDEATSALDTKAERAVQEGLAQLMAGRTSLIIAHRLSTISSVDTIITLRDGRIDEMGSPQQLAASGGIYAQLLALQASATDQDRKRLQRFGIIE